MGLLAAAISDLAAGRGSCILVEGVLGIGKSELLASGLAGARQAGCQHYRATATRATQDAPLHVLTASLGLDPAAWAAPGGDPRASPADPPLAGVERILATVEERYAGSPVVLAIDDLHLADQFSLLAWSRLSRTVRHRPLLLVAACRIPLRRPEVSQLRRALIGAGCRLIRLGPLPAGVTIELAGRLAGATVVGPQLRQTAESAGGNPSYLGDLMRSLLDSGAVRVDAGRAELTVAQQDVQVPDSLAAAMADGLDALSGQAREVLRLAAVAGATFTVADVARVANRPVTDLMAAVDEALHAAILTADGPRLAFRPPLIRQVLTLAIAEGERRALHLRFARSLADAGQPVERTAAHLLAARSPAATTPPPARQLAAPETADPWALDWLATSGDALVLAAPVTAVDLLGGVLDEVPPQDPRRTPVEAALAHAHLLLGHHADAARLARLVLSRTTGADRAGQMTWTLANALVGAGLPAEAEAVVQVVLGAARTAGAGRERWHARFAALQALIATLRGRYTEGRALAGAAEREAQLTGDRAALGYALYTSSLVERNGDDLPGALADVTRALEAVRDDPDAVDLRTLLLADAIALASALDRWPQAAAAVEEARTLPGWSPRQALVRTATAEHLYHAGSWDGALAEVGAVEQLTGGPRPPALYGIAALIHGRRDDQDRAASSLRLAAAQADRAGATQAEPASTAGTAWPAEYGEGFLRLATALQAERAGELARALAALAAMLSPGYPGERYLCLPDLVRLALAAGEKDRAAEAVQACRSEVARAPLPVRQAALDRCEGLLEDDPDRLLTAAEYHRSAGRLPDLGGTLEDAAVLQAAAGRMQPARTAAAEAFDTYQRLGAVWDAARAQERLLAFGIRGDRRGPRRRPASGWAALTPTELTVARLVASGLSNPDIAAALHLSPRTIQTHVSHILAKLGARSRREVGEIAATGDA